MLSRKTLAEGVLHLGLMQMFLLALQPVPSLRDGVVAPYAADAIWLALAMAVIVPLAALGRPSRVLMRTFTALVYLLVVAELRFSLETGVYFSAVMAIHAMTAAQDTLRVVAPTVFDAALLWRLLAAGLLWLLPQLMTATRLGLWAACGGTALGVLTAAPGVIADVLQPPSLFATFLAPPERLPSAGVPDYPYQAPRLLPGHAGTPPDLLIVVLESVRADAVPGFAAPPGARQADMPQLARLAATSRRFQRAYTTTSHTSKALVGLLCGHHPHPGLAIREAEPDDLPGPCLPTLLREAGYRTLFLSSATGEFEQRRELTANMGFAETRVREDIGAGFAASGYFGADESALVAPLTTWWRAPRPGPRLAVLLTSVTHHPYQLPGAGWPDGARAQYASYLAGLGQADAMLGEVLEKLGTGGGLDNTIIVVTGDHGEGFGEHGRFQHDSTPYEEGIRVPLLLADRRGGVISGDDRRLRQHTDILPTLLSLAGLHVTGRLPGRDLLDSQGHDQIITSCWHVDGCMSLVEAGGGKWVLTEGRMAYYRLDADPGERVDLAPAQAPEVTAAVRSALLAHRLSLRRLWEPAR